MNDLTAGSPARPPTSRRYQLVVAVAIAIAALALFAGIRATESADGSNVLVNGRPDVVEHLVPADGAQVLHQAEVGIDLAPGYEGALVIDGTPIPDEELRVVAQQNQVFYAPGPDRTFEALPSGRNCVTAIVWRSSAGRGTADDLTFQWCFDVT